MRAKEHFEHTVSWFRAHERRLSALFMAGGFAFDSQAFGRIDHPVTQAVFIVYLLAAGIAIAALHGLESRPNGWQPPPKLRAVLVFITQFALGALLSGFCVFYIRSASIINSWPFLLFMAAIFIGNEYFRHYSSRLVFVALLLFFSIYSYAIMLVPVVIGRIGQVPFLISGGVAAVLFFLYMRAIARLGHERYHSARLQIAGGALLIAAVLNAFYFFRVFPPLPLVLTDAGVYHSVKRVGSDVQVTGEDEPARWRELFGFYPVEHIQANGKLYLYSAIFAPRGVHTPIIHEWQWQNGQGGWITQQRLSQPITGGRDDGFRFATNKTAPRPGQWRVNILSDDGRAIGRVRFAVEVQAVPPALGTKILK
jgi:hypothetical protein